MQIIIAILIFGIIVLIHEFGHFIVAKKSGIKVLEFSVGMGPKLYTYKGKETDYCLKALPLGGSCMMLGEDTEEENLEGSFNSAPILNRIATIAAGPIFNFILAFVMAVIIISFTGIAKPYVAGVIPDYPAAQAGMQAGETITAINGERVTIDKDITLYLMMNPGKDVDVTVEGGKTYSMTPKYDAETQRYYIGTQFMRPENPSSNVFEIIRYSGYEVLFNIKATIKGLAHMIRGKISPSAVSGPVGIVKSVGESVEESADYGVLAVVLTIVNLTLIISANLGVMNLLPIPALDGGRLVFLIIEAIMRKPINRKIEGMVHFTGFALLMIIMVLVMYNDIVKIFIK